jgi:Tol biopolymer transport system component
MVGSRRVGHVVQGGNGVKGYWMSMRWMLWALAALLIVTAHGHGAAVGIPGLSVAAARAAEPDATADVPYSPGGHIAFSFWNRAVDRCTYEINVIDVTACLEGSAECQATRRIFPLNNVSEPALSADGARIAFRGWGDPSSTGSPFINCAPALKARYLANTTLDGTGLRGTGGYWEDAHPDWSPDGQRILFDSSRNGDQITRLYVINADGSGEGDLRIAGQQPSWAPDNQRFVYRGCDLTGNRCGLWLAQAAPVMSWDTGKNMIGTVVADEMASHPDWSPVADEVVYQTPASGNWNLMLVGAAVGDGSANAPLALLADPALEGLPAWSPDGQWIAYVSDAGGTWGIWIVRRDGSDRHLLFTFDGGVYALPEAWEPYGTRDWLDEQISWSR